MKTLIFILFSIPFFACAVPDNEVTQIEYDPVTTYEDGTPITDTVNYYIYWKSGGNCNGTAYSEYTDTQRIDAGPSISVFLNVITVPDGVYCFTGTARVLSNEGQFSGEIKANVKNGKFYQIGPNQINIRFK